MSRSCGIKFCGLRTEADVKHALTLGVDAIGFVLSESPRQVTSKTARALRRLVPTVVRVHAVFGPDDPSRIRQLFEKSGADVAQVTGHEADGDYWAGLSGVPLIRGFRVRGAETLEALRCMQGQAFLLDAYVPGRAGGTGACFDWTLAREAGKIGRVILAGGLTPDNVADAIRIARPHMVDVSGGIESEKGVKDPERMTAFAAAVRKDLQ